MRNIDHFIASGAVPTQTRFGDVFDPNNGGVQARVPSSQPSALDGSGYPQCTFTGWPLP